MSTLAERLAAALKHQRAFDDDPTRQAGREAERQAGEALAVRLAGTGWQIHAGRRVPDPETRQRREIDFVITSPTEAIVVELKNWSGTVRMEGREVVQERRGQLGVVRHGPLFDDPTRAIVERRKVTGELIWSRQHPDPGTSQGRGIAEDSKGAIVVAGYQSANGGDNVWVAKYSPVGDLVWTRSWGVGNSVEWAEDCALDSQDNIVFAGRYSNNGTDVLVGKYSSAGELLWSAKTPAEQSNRRAHSVSVATDDTISVVGTVDNPSDLWAGRFTAAGAPIWAKTEAGDWAYSVTNDGAGNLLYTGYTPWAVLTTKMKPDGTVIWYQVEDTPSLSEDGEAIAVDPDGYILIAARISSEVMFAKYAP